MKLLIVLIVLAIILLIKSVAKKDSKVGATEVILTFVVILIFVVAEIVFKIRILKWLLG